MQVTVCALYIVATTDSQSTGDTKTLGTIVIQEYYETVALQYDKVAERIKMLGGYPITSLKKIEDTSTMKSMRSMDYNGGQVLEVLQNDFGFMKVYTKDLIHSFEREEDYGTASMLGEFLQFYDKEFWMIDSSLK